MLSTRVASTFVVVTVLAVCVGLLIGYGAAPERQGSPQALVPFAAQRNELHYGPRDSQPRADLLRSIARRSDGSTVDRFTGVSPTGEHAEYVTITDLRKGIEVRTEPFTRSVTSLYLSGAEVAARRAAEDACQDDDVRAALAVHSPVERPELVLGHTVVRVDLQPDQKWHISSWVAPALNCLEMRREDHWSDGAHNEAEITQLEQGEPREKLFELPSGYVERSPAEVEAAYTAKYPGKSFWGERTATRLETRYRSHLANRPN
ncbi:MAG: hypothetical protein ABSH46_02310 [Bryobacteraceae bacterium]